MGAFRGGYARCCSRDLKAMRYLEANNLGTSYRFFGFLLGATLAGSGSYYYILADYKASNELLQDDIYVRESP